MTGDAAPADGNISAAIPGAVAISLLFALATLLYVIRMYTRIRPTFQLSAADYIVSIAFVCALTAYISTVIAVSYGFGRYSYYISDANQIKILKCIYVVAFMGGLSCPISRISIGLMLLRFQLTAARKVVLWILILIQLLFVIAIALVMLLQCQPIRTFWESVPDGSCWSNEQSRIFGRTNTSIGMVSDLIFAIMPLFFIWTLNRPVIERVLMSVLMGFGVTAAIAGAMKLYYIGTWKFGEPGLNDTVANYMWFRVEEVCLIASACAPFLKPPMEHLLNRTDLSKFGFIGVSLKSLRSRGSGNTATNVSNGDSHQDHLTRSATMETSNKSVTKKDGGEDGVEVVQQEMDVTERV